MEQQAITQALQLELLVLLAFFEKQATIIHSLVPVELYDSLPVQNLARDCHKFIETYKTPPKEHFNEIISKYFTGKDRELYESLFNRIQKLKDGINPDYVMSMLDKWLSKQCFLSEIVKAMAYVEKDDIDSARKHALKAIKPPTMDSSPGLFMSKSFDTLYAVQPRSEFITGILPLDKDKILPGRGELMLILGLSGKSKSWFGINMGAKNAELGKKIFHVTLEMSTQQTATRYAMNIMKITSDLGKDARIYKLEESLSNDYTFTLEHRHFPGLYDEQVRTKIADKLNAEIFSRIVIKHWPSRVLTISKLEAHLDLLANAYDFMPDLMIVDYPEEFFIPQSSERRDIVITDITRDLRRIAEERNLAVVAPSQSNRGGAKKDQLGADDIAEAYTKIPVCDVAFSVNMTDEEKKLGLMRITIIKNRDGRDFNNLVVANSLDGGQFAISSVAYHEKQYKEWLVINGNTTSVGT